MKQDAPVRLLVATVAVVVAVNVVAAQLIARAFYRGAGLQLGTTALVVLAVAAVVGIVYLVRGWRRYMAGDGA